MVSNSFDNDISRMSDQEFVQAQFANMDMRDATRKGKMTLESVIVQIDSNVEHLSAVEKTKAQWLLQAAEQGYREYVKARNSGILTKLKFRAKLSVPEARLANLFSRLELPLTAEEAALVKRINDQHIPLPNLGLDAGKLLRLAPHLEYVSFVSRQSWPAETITKFIKSCTNLVELHISDDRITELPSEVSKCRKLYCSGCPNLTALPPLSKCEVLDCDRCKKLRVIPPLQQCKELHCYGIRNITALPALPKCEYLDCGFTNVASLPLLPACKDLRCQSTPLSSFPALDVCEKLDCSHMEITALPTLPACKNLNCSECDQLAVIGPQPRIEGLDCHSCGKLTAIGTQVRCLIIDCHDCPLLARVEEQPACRILQSDDCPMLTTIGDLAPAVQVFTEEAPTIRRRHIEVNEKTLREQPAKVLKELGPRLMPGLFPSVQFILDTGHRSPGQDEGGLRRDLLTRLFENLHTTGAIAEKAPISPEALFTAQNDGLLPLAHNDETREACFIMGQIFACCYNEELLVGPHFSSLLFDTLRTLSEGDLKDMAGDIKACDQIPETVLPQLVAKVSGESFSWMPKLMQSLNVKDTPPTLNLTHLQNQKDAETATYFLQTDPLDPDSKVPDPLTLAYFNQKIRDFLAENPKTAATTLAFVHMAKGMHSILGSQWNAVRDLNATTLQNKIEGSLSEELVKARLTTISETDTDKKYLEWTRRWIDENKDQLRDFVKAVTGSSSLGPDTKIKLDLYEPTGKDIRARQGRLPFSHTCFNKLDLPSEYPDYETFSKKLTDFVSQSLAGGFTAA